MSPEERAAKICPLRSSRGEWCVGRDGEPCGDCVAIARAIREAIAEELEEVLADLGKAIRDRMQK